MYFIFCYTGYVESKFPSFSSKDFRNAVKIKLNNEDKRMRNQAIKYYARVVIIFINDIKDNMGPWISAKLFADDMKFETHFALQPIFVCPHSSPNKHA